MSSKSNATFRKKHFNEIFMWSAIPISWREERKRRTFFFKSSDPDSCEIEKCTMRNHQIDLTNRFMMHN